MPILGESFDGLQRRSSKDKKYQGQGKKTRAATAAAIVAAAKNRRKEVMEVAKEYPNRCASCSRGLEAEGKINRLGFLVCEVCYKAFNKTI